MLAKVYAPTVAQRRVGLEVAGRFWTRWLFIRTAICIAVPLAFGWYEADFAYPFPLDTGKLIVGVVAAVVTEIFVHRGRAGRAKSDAEWEAQLAQQHGPLLYRFTNEGLELLQAGRQIRHDWDAFSRFKATDELLVLVHSGGGADSWVFPTADIGESLLPVVLEKLEQSGATRL